MVRMEVSSPAFAAGEMLPSRFTREGVNISPPLLWGPAPDATRSLILIMEDPDIPMPSFLLSSWVHWIVYNIPPHLTALSENQPHGDMLANNALQGRNSWRGHCYGGPCPPFGTHRYFFRLYALDTILILHPRHATKRALIKSMKGHVLAEGELMVLYRHQQ
jgi:hypothetical protein